MKYIFVLLFMSACAKGIEIQSDDTSEDPLLENVNDKYKDAGAIDESKDSANPINCKVESYWIGDCNIISIFCENDAQLNNIKCLPYVQFDIKKHLPDPPP